MQLQDQLYRMMCNFLQSRPQGFSGVQTSFGRDFLPVLPPFKPSQVGWAVLVDIFRSFQKGSSDFGLGLGHSFVILLSMWTNRSVPAAKKTRLLNVFFGKLKWGAMRFSEEWLSSGHSTIKAWWKECFPFCHYGPFCVYVVKENYSQIYFRIHL